MDLSPLIERELAARLLAEAATTIETRAAQLAMADCYRALIDSQRRPRLVAVPLPDPGTGGFR